MSAARAVDTPGPEDTCLVSITGPGTVVEGQPATGYTVSLSQPAATDVTVQLTYSGTASRRLGLHRGHLGHHPAGQTRSTFDLARSTMRWPRARKASLSRRRGHGGGSSASRSMRTRDRSLPPSSTMSARHRAVRHAGRRRHLLVCAQRPRSVTEGNTATGYTVSLSQPAVTDVTVQLIYSGTATEGSDYTKVTSVTIAAGQSSTSFDLARSTTRWPRAPRDHGRGRPDHRRRLRGHRGDPGKRRSPRGCTTIAARRARAAARRGTKTPAWCR